MNDPSKDFILLIPCYNNKEGLITSLSSISYPGEKFEVLIIDDGSTEPINQEELRLYCKGAIQVVHMEKNAGVVVALNAGLRIIKSRNDIKYIARLDAGDTCHEQRFFRQVEFLNNHPNIALLASWARFQSTTSSTAYNYTTKTKHGEILKEMHLKCSFIHPAVIFRKEILDTVGFYPDQYSHAEDYAFFWKILKSYQGAVIPEILVQISYSDRNVSARNYRQQLRSRKKIVKEFGNNYLQKLIGIGILNLKLVTPAEIIQCLKSV